MMCDHPSRGRLPLLLAMLVILPLGAWRECRADQVIMKNGLVYVSQGPPDKDNSLYYIWDGLKRVVVRDSKVEKVTPGNHFRTGEKFQLIQPITVHAGAMPKEVISVQAGPWDDRGRRDFRYSPLPGRTVRMEQAIIEIGPHIIRYRGIDGFWVGVVETSQVPHSVIMALIGRVEQKNAEERERVVRFLIDAGWYPEARQELDRLIQDFPGTELSERAAGARVFITQAQASQRRSEVDLRRRAQQYRAVGRLLKTFQEKDIGVDLQVEARELERRDQQQAATDKALAVDLRRLSGRLTPSVRGPWQKAMVEILKAIDEAPDAVRDRFTAWQKARSDPKVTDEARFALAMSGYVVGHDMAVPDLKAAEVLWQAREAARGYLVSADPSVRSGQAAGLEGLSWPSASTGVSDPVHRLELLTRIVQLMPPPRHDPEQATDKTILHRVLEDENAVPTEYAVRLPPEYHPLRHYPAVVILHSGPGPSSAIDEWADEAARHGYILIAPQYNLPGQPHDYRYTTSEHAAVELALRDARKRYAVDSDRVFIAGQITGGNMAWDYSLSHPDLFAGAIVLSGLPAKYVPAYALRQQELVPLYCVLGELAPAAGEVIYDRFLKPMILKAWDVTYVEYQRRGLETFPEEVPRALDWMDRHRREPYPKSFSVVTARESDDRFYGVVVKGFVSGRTTAPEAVEVLGQNLSPAEIKMSSSSISNLIKLDVKGIRSLDVWLNPKTLNLKGKGEPRVSIRVNGKNYLPGRKAIIKLDLESMLDDLRVRGDREQLYWHRISIQ